MFNKKYKKGMADAAKAYEAFGKKQEDALKHILEEVRQGKRDLESVLRELNGNIDGLYDYINSKEKAHLYSVYTPFDILNLNKNDRLFLVGVLCRLTVDKAPNENQQNYIRAVQKYLDVKEPPFGIDPMYIETIEDIPTQKAILQTVLEYLCLQDGDCYDETEYQQEFLDAFSVNAKGRKEIMDHIDLLYTATGAKGLAEKYGYVPEEESSAVGKNVPDSSVSIEGNFQNASEELLDQIFTGKVIGRSIGICVETENHIITFPDRNPFNFFGAAFMGKSYKSSILASKKTLEESTVENLSWVNDARKLEVAEDTVIIECGGNEKTIETLDLHSGNRKILAKGGIDLTLLRTKNNYIVYSKGQNTDVFVYVYNVLTEKTQSVMMPTERYAYYTKTADIVNDSLYLVDSECMVYQFDLGNNILLNQQWKIAIPGWTVRALRISGTQAFCWSQKGNYEPFLSQINLENGQYTQLASVSKDSLLWEKNIYNDYFIYREGNNGPLYGIDLRNFHIVKFTETVSGDAYYIGDWIYFQREGSEWYKVNVNRPLQAAIVM